jgi:hypothetical protein
MSKERWYVIEKPGVKCNLYPMTHKEARAFRRAQMEPNDWSFKEVPLTTRRYTAECVRGNDECRGYMTLTIHARHKCEAVTIAKDYCEKEGYVYKSIVCIDSYLRERGPIGIVK